MQKFLERATAWGASPAGLFFTSVAYLVYILSVLTFVLQLERVPARWDEVETAAMRKLLPGPGNWCSTFDAHHLRELGLTRDLPGLHQLSLAVKLRVAAQEATSSGGLEVQRKAAELANWRLHANAAGWAYHNRHWYDSSYVLQLHGALQHFAANGVTPQVIENDIAQHAPRPFDRAAAARVRSRFQRVARDHLRDLDLGKFQQRVRAKLTRWRILLFPRIRMQRMLASGPRLVDILPPRVLAAVWRTRWNGWVTQRRMQSLPGCRRRCIFQCSPTAEDSIEHYACCPRVAEWARRDLGLDQPEGTQAKLAGFLLLDPPVTALNDEALAARALRTASVYRTHCFATHGKLVAGTTAQQSLRQSVKELVNGHHRATQLLTTIRSRLFPPHNQ